MINQTTAFGLGVRLGVLSPPFADDLTIPLRDPRPIAEVDRRMMIDRLAAVELQESRRPVVSLDAMRDLASLRAYYASAPLRPGARRHSA